MLYSLDAGCQAVEGIKVWDMNDVLYQRSMCQLELKPDCNT